jgi:hypothetical protein
LGLGGVDLRIALPTERGRFLRLWDARADVVADAWAQVRMADTKLTYASHYARAASVRRTEIGRVGPQSAGAVCGLICQRSDCAGEAAAFCELQQRAWWSHGRARRCTPWR